MRKFVYTMFISNNHPLLHLWWKKNLVKQWKVSKYFETDCRSIYLSTIKFHQWLKKLGIPYKMREKTSNELKMLRQQDITEDVIIGGFTSLRIRKSLVMKINQKICKSKLKITSLVLSNASNSECYLTRNQRWLVRVLYQWV